MALTQIPYGADQNADVWIAQKNSTVLINHWGGSRIKLEQMTNKELLISFSNYAKSRHQMPILDSYIEPLVDDYLQEQLLQQTPCTTHVCHICGGSNGHTIECTAWCGNTVTV